MKNFEKMRVKLIIFNGRMSILKLWRTTIPWIIESFKSLRMKFCKRRKSSEVNEKTFRGNNMRIMKQMQWK